MAAVERDGADDLSSTEDYQPRARGNLYTARSDKPIFTSLHNRERITFGKKARGEDENARPGTQSGSSRRDWMSGRGMRLGEAFHRADGDGNFLPRLSAHMADSESRIPRTKSFSPPIVSPSPPHRARNGENIQARSSSVPLDSESDTTGLLQGSPSPAARNRRQRRENRMSDVSQNSSGRHFEPSAADRKFRRNVADQERVGHLRARDSPSFLSRTPVDQKVQETARTLADKTNVKDLEDEPPLRVPNTWGTKAKKKHDWMANIVTLEPPEDVSSRKQRAVDIPMPSVEDTSVQALTPPISRPASARPTNLSPEKSQMWHADLDFTAQSLQLSSPQLRMKPTKLDEIRARERENLEARAVAAHRLEEIQERNSDRSIAEDIARAGFGGPGLKDVQKIGGLDKKATILEGNEYHKSRNPTHAYSSRSTENKTSSDEKDVSQLDGLDESWENLRTLSRVLTSKSPTPPRIHDKEVKQPETAGPFVEAKPVERQTSTKRHINSRATFDTNAGFKRNSGTNSPPKSDVDPEERITGEARLFELQDNRSERNSLQMPSRSPSPSDDGKLDETPRPPKIDPMSLPTPKVTGAFIETPAPSARRPRKSRSVPLLSEEKILSDRISLERRGPGISASDASATVRRRQQPQNGGTRRSQPRPLTNSVKPTTAAEDLRRIKLEAQIEDSTVEDLDAFLEVHKRATADPEHNTSILEPVIDLEFDERGQPLSAKEIAKRVELLTLERMCQSIKKTSSSIRDARHGIERLEQQVSTSSIPNMERLNGATYIVIPVPRFITYNPNPRPGWRLRNWKFTWFGFIIVTSIVWFISEIFMCNEFCYADQSFNSIRDNPRRDPYFPWAIPTKLDQWTGEVVSSLFWYVYVALGGERPCIYGWKTPEQVDRDRRYMRRRFF